MASAPAVAASVPRGANSTSLTPRREALRRDAADREEPAVRAEAHRGDPEARVVALQHRSLFAGGADDAHGTGLAGRGQQRTVGAPLGVPGLRHADREALAAADDQHTTRETTARSCGTAPLKMPTGADIRLLPRADGAFESGEAVRRTASVLVAELGRGKARLDDRHQRLAVLRLEGELDREVEA